MHIRRAIDHVLVWGNREPILTIRRVLWLLTGGLWLALAYVFAALAMACTIVFLPYTGQVLRIALFALDGGITLEPYMNDWAYSSDVRFWVCWLPR